MMRFVRPGSCAASRARWRAPTAVLVALGLTAGVACAGPQAMESGRAAPALGGQASGTPAPGTLPDAPQQAQEIPLQIVDGRFPAIRLNVRPGPVRLTLSARGGPYTLRIDPLLAPRAIPADSTTLVGFTASTPGEYVMELSGGGKTETAILDVQPAPRQ